MKLPIIIVIAITIQSNIALAKSVEERLKEHGSSLTNSLIDAKSKYSEDTCYFGLIVEELKEGVTLLSTNKHILNTGIVPGDVFFNDNKQPYKYTDELTNKLSLQKYPGKLELNIYNPVDGFRTITTECPFSRGEMWKDFEPLRKYLSIARGEHIITEINFLREKYGDAPWLNKALAAAHLKFAKASKSEGGKKQTASELHSVFKAASRMHKIILNAFRFSSDSKKYRAISSAREAASAFKESNHYDLSRSLRNTIEKTSSYNPIVVNNNLPINPAEKDTQSKQKEKTNFTQSGTCFFISKDKALTNFHVVEKAAEIEIIDSLDRKITATISKKDSSNDLAVLKFDITPPSIIKFSQLGSLKQGAKILALGFPLTSILGKEIKITDGIVSSLTGISDESHLFQMTNPLQPGNSGGPVITETGKLIGVSVSTADAKQFFDLTGHIPQNINWAIKSDYASVFSGVYPENTASLDRETAIENAIAATCKVRIKQNT